MTEFHRLLSAFKAATMAAARNPGPRQINWMTQAELNVLSYVTKMTEAKNVE